MKPYSRLKESLKSILYICIGLSALYFVSARLKALDIDSEMVVVHKEVDEQKPVSELEIKLDIDQLYEYIDESISEEGIMQLLRNHVPGGIYLTEVALVDNNILRSSMLKNSTPISNYCIAEESTYKTILTYVIEENTPVLNKSRKDQIALLDASILMSLYPEIDVIKVNINMESEVYSKILYRPDIEDYFGVDISGKDGKKAFERVANEFIDLSHVSGYINRKHPYDSSLGDEVEAFYKMNFPVIKGEERFPYIDEDLEEELVKKYGYKLFLQGLKYENSLINYYSAYRLVENYGTAYSEEIMLELATLATKSHDHRVMQACYKVVDLLAPLKEEVRVFDRFNESILGGGKRLYRITGKGVSALATWQGEECAGLKMISLAPNEDYVLCEAVTSQHKYRYILPYSEEVTYSLSEKGVFVGGTKVTSELITQVNSIVDRKSAVRGVDLDEIKWEWHLRYLMQIRLGEETELIYNVKNDKIESKAQYMENFDLEELEYYLKDQFETVTQTTAADKDSKAQVKKFVVDGEILTVYAYDYVNQKNIELLAKERQATKIIEKIWGPGKLMICYSGSKDELINKLNQLRL